MLSASELVRLAEKISMLITGEIVVPISTLDGSELSLTGYILRVTGTLTLSNRMGLKGRSVFKFFSGACDIIFIGDWFWTLLRPNCCY
jgi:hypothetical protein